MTTTYDDHEWNYESKERPKLKTDKFDRLFYDQTEPVSNLTTWVYDGGSYTPVAKITEDEQYSILHDYLGTPVQAYDSKGKLVWDALLDIYGNFKELNGDRHFIPFRWQGQYEDRETGLFYNRFRYYDPNSGNYISRDPIGLAGGNPTLYRYVGDTNGWLDVFGFGPNPITFTDSRELTLEVRGYTDISHLNDAELKAIYHANDNASNGKGYGLTPPDKKGNEMNLHHYRQNPQGPIIAMPKKHHDKPHTNPGQHPFGKKKGGGLTGAERIAFDRWKHEFWRHQAETELKKRGKNIYSK